MENKYLSNGDMAIALLCIMFINGSKGIDIADAIVIWLIK